MIYESQACQAGSGTPRERAAEITERAPVGMVLALGPGELGSDLLTLAAAEPADPLPSRARPRDIRTIRRSGGPPGPSRR